MIVYKCWRPEQDVYPEFLKCLRAMTVIDLLYSRTDMGHDMICIDVQRWMNCQPVSSGIYYLMGYPACLDEGLARYAAIERALSAQFILFNHGNLFAQT